MIRENFSAHPNTSEETILLEEPLTADGRWGVDGWDVTAVIEAVIDDRYPDGKRYVTVFKSGEEIPFAEAKSNANMAAAAKNMAASLEECLLIIEIERGFLVDQYLGMSPNEKKDMNACETLKRYAAALADSRTALASAYGKRVADRICVNPNERAL